MPNAFPPKPGCPVPVVEAISGVLAPFTVLCVPPDPIFEFPAFEFPLPEPPGFNFGCYEPSLQIDFASSSPASFAVERTYPNESETGKCAPNLKFIVRIPTGGGGGNATVRVVSVDNQALGGIPVSIDCIVVVTGNTVLLIGQTDPTENGMYTLSSGTWIRTADTVSPGMIVTVRDGTLYKGSTWQLNTEGPITVDTTPLAFDSSGKCCCSARAASTVNLTLSGLQTVDGVSLGDGDIVLAKDQTLPANNGPYIVRSTAWEPTCVFSSGMLVTVREGATHAGTAFVLSTDGPLSCENTTAYTFVPLRAPGNVTVQATFVGGVTLSGVQSPDGVTGAADMVVLVKDQTTESQNGIYAMKVGTWVRTSDLIVSGMIVTVRSGARYGGTVFTLSTEGPITVDATGLQFQPGARTIIPADGATTGSVALTGIQTIDGIAGFSGRVVLVRAQSTASDNGVYVMRSGAWERTGGTILQMRIVSVLLGTLNGRSFWMADTSTPTFIGMGSFFR